MTRLGQMWRWWRPGCWGISARSAVVSGTVVLVALAVAGGGLALVLYRSLLSGIDDAAAGRVRDVVAALQFDSATQLDGALLATDQRVVAVQVIDRSGAVVARSQSAPATPLLLPGSIGSSMVVGLPDDAAPDGDMRFSGQTTDSPGGRYTVSVGGGSEGVEATVQTVVILLGCASPIVVAVAAGATYLLVGRSLRSVDAIRSRVAAISTSDLTERVPVPAARDEISALALTMNEMLARIEAGHAAQRRFVGDASHELRSPLATIISALEVAAAHPQLLDQDLAATTLMPEAHRMQALVEDLLLLARADERGLALRHADLDIAVELTPTRLAGDPVRLSRVLRNLLENAARHAVSRIEVRVYAHEGSAFATVADDGSGIAIADRNRVFDRFVRLDTDRARTSGGAGLGLAIVAEIVAAHSGTVQISDRPGGGALFLVQLPLG